MVEWMHQPGFLGTGANRATDVGLVVMLLVAALFTIGFFLARRGRYEAHKWVQTTAGAVTLLVVLWLMVLPYREFVLPGLPERLSESFHGLTTLHALLGLAALPFGSFVILRGHKLVPQALRFNDYKTFMRVAYALYMLTIALGVAVYVVWFVTNPDPPQF